MAESASVADLCNQLPIAIQREGANQERIPGQLLGLVSPDYLLLSGTDDAPLAKEERIVVRTLQSGKALGFATTVREVVEHPVRLYFVDMPQSVEVLKLRKSDRIDLFVPADIRFATGKESDSDTLLLRGNMVDVSGGGCRVFTKRSIPPSTVVNVSFTLPGERHSCVVSGSVLDVAPQNALFCERIKFFGSEKNLEDLAEIKRWIQQNVVFADLT